MSKRRTYTIKNLPADQTKFEQVKKMTERQINKAAREDADAPLLTKRQLAQFKRACPLPKVDVKQLREGLHISQAVFAAYFGISTRTLQDWEQGRRYPRGPARALLTVIMRRPQIIREILAN